jgi:diguanylate cyclase (GGDEF)-like protein/PAS domain S-box-containing protein
MITDAQGSILEVNNTFTLITGYKREEVLGRNPRLLQSGRHEPGFFAAMWQSLINEDFWAGEIWNRRKNGEIYAEMLTISTVRDADGQILNHVSLFTDITELKLYQKQLEYIAHSDMLTGLPNRVLLADRLHQAMSQCLRRDNSLAVIYLDLDGFKAINDGYGHDVGDQLLINISQRMKDVLRECDTLARIGGDEFVAVLADLDKPHDCEPVLARLLQAAADPVKLGDAVLQVSASIGVSFYPKDNVDADQLMRQADHAMYQAKQAGKNRYQLFDTSRER